MSKYSSYLTPIEEEPVEDQAPFKSKYADYLKPVATDGLSVEDQTEEAMPMEGVAPEGVRDLTRDDVFDKIRPYMDQRFGMNEDKFERQEIVDAYVNNMRKFEAGQSVVTLGELAYLYECQGCRAYVSSAAAYSTFQSMEGAFAEGTSSEEKLDAVYDYGRAVDC